MRPHVVVATLEPERVRRHVRAQVLVQQLCHGVEIAALDGVHEALPRRPAPPRSDATDARPVQPARGQVLLERRAGALQRAVRPRPALERPATRRFPSPTSRARRAGSAPPAASAAGAGSRRGTPARSSPCDHDRPPAPRRSGRSPRADGPGRAGAMGGRRRQPDPRRSGRPAGPSCDASTRRGVRASASRQAFVAILYSQARNEERPSALKLARQRHARRNVSCTRSSESSNEPSIR